MRNVDQTVVFLDLAGTLVDADEPLNPYRADALQRLSQSVRRVVLVTGQSSDDPQVQAVARAFSGCGRDNFVAYVTRGGCRLCQHDGQLICDSGYTDENHLEVNQQAIILSHVENTLRWGDWQPLIPVKCVDGVAIRVNLPPPDRIEFLTRLSDSFAQNGLLDFQVVSEGRTSIFIMRGGVGKKKALQHEISLLSRNDHMPAFFYFGNEFFPGGNDREVLEIADVTVCALGDLSQEVAPSNCRVIGAEPDDTYRVLRRLTQDGPPLSFGLPVVCLSLGGTKIDVGALTEVGNFLNSQRLEWRGDDSFSETLEDASPERFCELLVRCVSSYLAAKGYRPEDVATIGIPFPGPEIAGRWYSHNLTLAFRDGVDLRRGFKEAFYRRHGTYPVVRVAFDAQADAGGELYHPKGQLHGLETESSATVLNLATGVAAGFISGRKVLMADEDFHRHVGIHCDGGAGQLGRHLWYDAGESRWQYHFVAHGGLPNLPNAIRMTDRLSGPALAARLLLQLGDNSCLPRNEVEGIPVRDFEQYYDKIHDVGITAGGIVLRREGASLTGALLRLADNVYFRGEASRLTQIVENFAHSIAAELAQALKCFFDAPGWDRFRETIVLTGGVGIGFLQSSDAVPQRSFLNLLRQQFTKHERVCRSRISRAAERECYLFLAEPESFFSEEHWFADDRANGR